MNNTEFLWTDETNSDFQVFYQITEDYYSSLVGGESKHKGFVPYNASAEIKRVWVQPLYRGSHIASRMMNLVEQKAGEQGFARVILQTRPQMTEAVAMYTKRGYYLIPNYPPYDKLVGAVCYAKDL